MARSATPQDIVAVIYDHVDAARRQIGVAPIQLGQAAGAQLRVSVRPGMGARVPPSILVELRGEEVQIALIVDEDYR